jgi:hypothetical protein
MIVWIAIFIFGIPIFLSLLGLIGSLSPVQAWIHSLMKLSVVVGGILLGVLIVLLLFEQIQDAMLTASYDKNRKKRIPVSPEFFECQFCGCRRVREFETTCPVCGKELE